MELLNSFLSALIGSGIMSIVAGYILNSNLEEYKSHLNFLREITLYLNKSQFEKIIDIWGKLIDLDMAAFVLYKKTTPENMKSFIKELIDTKLIVRKSSIILSRDHYQRLVDIIEKYYNLKSGKETLLEIYNRGGDYRDDVDVITNKNKSIIHDFRNLLSEIEISFRDYLAVDYKKQHSS